MSFFNSETSTSAFLENIGEMFFFSNLEKMSDDYVQLSHNV